MKTKIPCFWMEPSEVADEMLRRYSRPEKPCGSGYHNAVVHLGQVPWPLWKREGASADDFPHDDPRWPTTCGCGYVFTNEDYWQHNYERLYQRRDNGELVSLRSPPAGAMWNADWWQPIETEDGRYICVQLPDGTPWMIDGPSKGGGHWTRVGAPPEITVRPSILTSSYHGFLTNGVLEEL